MLPAGLPSFKNKMGIPLLVAGGGIIEGNGIKQKPIGWGKGERGYLAGIQPLIQFGHIRENFGHYPMPPVIFPGGFHILAAYPV